MTCKKKKTTVTNGFDDIDLLDDELDDETELDEADCDYSEMHPNETVEEFMEHENFDN